MAQKVGRREKKKSKCLGRREKLAQKVGRREKLAQKVERREIYPPVPPPPPPSECTRNAISSSTSCNPALGLHMEDFREQITAMYLKK